VYMCVCGGVTHDDDDDFRHFALSFVTKKIRHVLGRLPGVLDRLSYLPWAFVALSSLQPIAAITQTYGRLDGRSPSLHQSALLNIV